MRPVASTPRLLTYLHRPCIKAAAMLAVTKVPLLFDPRPAARYVSEIADEALHLTGDMSRGVS